jgi:hypothetical protein
MRNPKDLAILQEMQLELARCSKIGSTGELVERLLRLRDDLSFENAKWYHEFTQHVATLDSAFTFRPADDFEKNKMGVAIATAISQMETLIKAQLE